MKGADATTNRRLNGAQLEQDWADMEARITQTLAEYGSNTRNGSRFIFDGTAFEYGNVDDDSVVTGRTGEEAA